MVAKLSRFCYTFRTVFCKGAILLSLVEAIPNQAAIVFSGFVKLQVPFAEFRLGSTALRQIISAGRNSLERTRLTVVDLARV